MIRKIETKVHTTDEREMKSKRGITNEVVRPGGGTAIISHVGETNGGVEWEISRYKIKICHKAIYGDVRSC